MPSSSESEAEPAADTPLEPGQEADAARPGASWPGVMSAKENNSDFCRESTGRPTATSIVDGGPTSSGPRLGSGSAGGVPDAPSEGLGEPDGDADASALGESASAGSPVGAEDSPSAVTNAATLSTPENQPPTTGPPEPLQRLGDADDAPGPPEADGSTGSVGSGSASEATVMLSTAHQLSWPW